MSNTKVMAAALMALAIAGCNRGERNRANETGNAQAGNTQTGMTPPPPPIASGPATATGPAAGGGLQIDTQALIRSCLNPADATRPLSSFTDEQKLALVICGNREAARQAMTQMPMRVDDATTLTSIVADGPTVIYNVRVNANAADVPDAGKAQIEAAARANACSRPDMRQTMSMGGAYAYSFSDRAGQPIMQFRIEGC
ncbi:MAG TPA: hypothetical protein VGO55_16010 [Allosphingosinicella sp.]|jgi:hypothetical protein|nr:hypothetical protein [Allosphingosinicella sp.]